MKTFISPAEIFTSSDATFISPDAIFTSADEALHLAR